MKKVLVFTNSLEHTNYLSILLKEYGLSVGELSSQVRRERGLEGMLCPAGVLVPWFGVSGPTLSIFPGDIKVALLQAIFAPITSLLLVVHAAVLDPQSPWNFTLTLKRHFQLTAGRPRPCPSWNDGGARRHRVSCWLARGHQFQIL